MTDGNLLSGSSLSDSQLHHASKILSEIIDRDSVDNVDADRMQFFVGFYRRTVIRQDLRVNPQGFQAGFVPRDPLRIHRGVVCLAVVNIRHANTAVPCHFPGFVRSDDFFRAVFILDAELQQKSLPVTVVPVDPCKHKGTYRPTSGHDRSNRILGPERIRHIIGLILEPILVGSKPWREIAVPYPLAV